VEVLNDIRETVYQDVNVVKAPDLYTYSDYGRPFTLFPGSNKAWELDGFIFDSLFSRGKRGVYELESGRIFLRKGSWCRSTFIHETLHSVSLFSEDRNIRVGIRYRFLNEGLTQFLTGYILWNKYQECYNAWKNKIYQQWCALGAYEDMTRIWYTFSRFIDLKEIKKLYFSNSASDWGGVWREFITSMNNAGYNFSVPLSGSNARFQDRFVDQCKRTFGEYEFNRILEMESSDLDYGSIISSE
jgi:hypothetical protein